MTATRRVLMVSPHFPPDSSAATHRVRLLAPALGALGWEPTVLTLTQESYEGVLEPALLDLVPAGVRVERVAAWPAARTRVIGVGDLGLRAWTALHRRARALLEVEHYDVLFWTVYPTWPAASGPALAHAAGAAFVLDLQDPWVGAWGDSVGGGADGRPDLRSRVSRLLSVPLERRTVSGADGLSAVSQGTLDALARRVPAVRELPQAEVPLVAGDADLAWALRARSGSGARNTAAWDARDGRLHVAWVGTLLPHGIVVLRALLDGLAEAVRRDAALADRVRVHFVGTSNESRADAPLRALSVARDAGVLALVTEHAPRVGYRDALRLLADADAVLLGGSTEAHYTASRLYPTLLGGAPLLAAYRDDSHAMAMLRAVVQPPVNHLVSFGAAGPDAATVRAAADGWRAIAATRSRDATARGVAGSVAGGVAGDAMSTEATGPSRVAPFAHDAAIRLAALLDAACLHRSRRSP